MFLVLVTFVAMASAAPRILPNTHLKASDLEQYGNIYPSLDDFGITMNQFHIQFTSAPWTVAVENLQYVLSMSMPGYKKEDIEVLADIGMLVMRAIHKEEDKIIRSQILMTVLPSRVNPSGRWTYDGVLRVAFPIGNIGTNVDGDDGSSAVTRVNIGE